MLWAILLTSIAVLIIAIYIYIKWKYYTVRGSIPGLEPEFAFGNLRQLGIVTSNKELIDSYIHGVEQMQHLYGDIFQFWIGSSHMYVFCRPEHAEQIWRNRDAFDRSEFHRDRFSLIAEHALVTLIGPKYKRHAKAILPMLRRNKFLSQIPLMVNCVDQLIDIWKQRYENQDNTICACMVNDIQQLMVDIFGLLAYDYDFGSLKHLSQCITLLNTEDKSKASDFGLALSNWLKALGRVTNNGMPFFINYYLLRIDHTYWKASKTLENYAERIILKCQKETHSNDKPANLIASLVSSLQKDEAFERSKRETEKTGLTKEEVLGEILAFTLAGFDATTSVMSWFIHYVSKKPEIQQKIKEELKRNSITKETPLDNFNLLEECKYIDCVVKETLRLASSAVGSFRTLTNNATIDGVKLRKGETVLVALAFIQNDPRNWKLDPTQFIPERFYGADAPDANHHPFAFIPFGGGHRGCVGQDLARLELKIIIARLMQLVTFVDAPGNNGGHRQQMTVVPKQLAVSIKFD